MTDGIGSFIPQKVNSQMGGLQRQLTAWCGVPCDDAVDRPSNTLMMMA